MTDHLISRDDHLDLSQRPADLWTTRLPASLLDRAPRPDSVWPNSRDAIERQMRHLSPEMRRKLTHDNAAALYGRRAV